MKVTVTTDDLDTVRDEGSVVVITGSTRSRRITFGGDHRSMAGLLAIVADLGEVTAAVEPWQVLSTESVPA